MVLPRPFERLLTVRAAETIEALPQNVAQLVAAGEDLSELPGIGEDLAVELKVIVDMGRLKPPPAGSDHQSRLRTVPASCRGRWRANARWLLGRQPRLRRQRRGAG
jgi:DNA polymerase/3'-5' exonuclease PolX